MSTRLDEDFDDPIPEGMYLCMDDGVFKRDRREYERGAHDEEIERLFNGFENAIGNAKDKYNEGYLKGMRNSFAEIVRTKLASIAHDVAMLKAGRAMVANPAPEAVMRLRNDLLDFKQRLDTEERNMSYSVSDMVLAQKVAYWHELIDGVSGA